MVTTVKFITPHTVYQDEPCGKPIPLTKIPVISRGGAVIYTASNKASISRQHIPVLSFIDLHSDAAGAGIAEYKT